MYRWWGSHDDERVAIPIATWLPIAILEGVYVDDLLE